MEKFTVPKQLCNEKISVLKLNKEMNDFLEQKNIATIRDIIKKQNEIPREYSDHIKRMIMLETFKIRNKE